MFSADVLDYLPTPFRYNCRGLGIFTKRVRLISRLALPDIKTNVTFISKKGQLCSSDSAFYGVKKKSNGSKSKMAGH